MDEIDKMLNEVFNQVNATNKEQMEAMVGLILIDYVKSNNLKKVKQMINKGYAMDVVRKYALITASYLGHTDIVKYLINIGVEIDINDNQALKVSLENGHNDVSKIIKYHLRMKKLKKIINDRSIRT